MSAHDCDTAVSVSSLPSDELPPMAYLTLTATRLDGPTTKRLPL